MTYRIYMITGPNGKRYIGKTGKTLEHRWRQHCIDARRALTYLHKALNKHGAAAFSMALIVECIDIREANAVERGLIAQYGTYAPRGYNMTSGGDGVTGWKFSAESRAKLSAMRTGKKFGPRSEVARAKMRAAKLGRKLSPDHRAKIGAALKGRLVGPQSPARRAQNAESQRRYWAAMSSDDPRRKEAGRKLGAASAKRDYAEIGRKCSATKRALRLSREIVARIATSIELANSTKSEYYQ